MPTPEATLRAAVLADIRRTFPRRTGVLVFGRPASGTTGPGHPDLFGVAGGRFLALELKTRTGRATPLQRQRISDLRSCGAYAWVVRSTGEARAAIQYTILGGGRPPMSDEPIDFNAWLNGLTEPAPPPITPPPPPPAVEEESSTLPWDDEPVAVAERTPAAQAFVDEIQTPEYQAKLNTPPPDLGTAPWPEEQALSGEQPTIDSLGVQAELLKLDVDVRTVGDRVTLVYERVDNQAAFLNSSVHRLIDMVLQLGTKLDTVLSQIEVVDGEPLPTTGLGTTKRQRRSRKQPEPEPEVTITGDALAATALEDAEI